MRFVGVYLLHPDGLDALQRPDQLGAEFIQFARVARRQSVEDTHSLVGDREDRAAAIGGIFRTLDQALSDGAVGKFDDAVLAKTEPLGEEADGCNASFRNARDLQHELMLPRLQVMILGDLFAEQRESAQVVAEFGECFEQGSWGKSQRHTITSYHDIIHPLCGTALGDTCTASRIEWLKWIRRLVDSMCGG